MNSPINITERAAIGLHALILLTAADAPLSSYAIADELNVSRVYVQKTMAILSEKGFVETVSGKGGGYRLSVNPSSVTALAVYEALTGPFTCNGCLFAAVKCRYAQCPFRDAVKACSTILRETLSNTTLSDFKTTIVKGEKQA